MIEGLFEGDEKRDPELVEFVIKHPGLPITEHSLDPVIVLVALDDIIEHLLLPVIV